MLKKWRIFYEVNCNFSNTTNTLQTCPFIDCTPKQTPQIPLGTAWNIKQNTEKFAGRDSKVDRLSFTFIITALSLFRASKLYCTFSLSHLPSSSTTNIPYSHKHFHSNELVKPQAIHIMCMFVIYLSQIHTTKINYLYKLHMQMFINFWFTSFHFIPFEICKCIDVYMK